MNETGDRVADAATRVRAWLNERNSMSGLDPEVLHTANRKELRASDLTLVLDALGRDR